jgi:hypothetical protein
MELPCIEVPLDLTVALCAPAHPFHWALLRVLTDFPASARPDFVELAERLRFSETAFLEQAWSELRSYGAVTAAEFSVAEINAIGSEALRLGYFMRAKALTRPVCLYFSARGDRCVERRDFEISLGATLKQPPAWSRTLTIDRIREAMRFQMPDKQPQEGERVLEFVVRWNDAREAVAKW